MNKFSNKSIYIAFLILASLYAFTNILGLFEDYSVFERLFGERTTYGRFTILYVLYDDRMIFILISLLLVGFMIRDIKKHVNQSISLSYVMIVMFSLLAFAQVLYVFGFGLYRYFEANRMIDFKPSIYEYLLIIYAFISIFFALITNKSNKAITFYDVDKITGRMIIPSLITLVVSILIYSIITDNGFFIEGIILLITRIGIPLIMVLPLKAIKKFFINTKSLSYLSIGVVLIMILMVVVVQQTLLIGSVFLELLIINILITMPFIYIYLIYSKTALSEGSERQLYSIHIPKLNFKFTSQHDESLFE